MILPIGHAESETRRLPWVTFGIMALCVVVFLATDPGSMQPGYDRESLLDDASAYWRDHAYLEPAPEIRTQVAYDVMPSQRKQYVELVVSQSYSSAPEDPAEWEVEQAELDRLTEYALGLALPPEVAESENVYREWGYLPESLLSLGLLTHIFMHAGWFHLLSNLFMLFLAGPPVEDRLGRPLFLGFFMAAGIFAALFWGVLALDKSLPLVGASGAIAGVLGAFFIRFWSTQIRFAYFIMVGFKPYLGTFEAQAWLMLPLWFGVEVLNGWVVRSIGLTGGVAYMAHVGGFLFGTGIVLGIRAFGIEDKYIDKAIESKITLVEANPAIDSAMALRAEGDHEAAFAALHEAWRESPTDRDVALALWDAAQAVERPEEGAAAAAGLMKQCVADGDKELAIQHWLDLHRLVPTFLADAPTLMRLLPELQAGEDPALTVRALRHCVDPSNATLTVGLAIRVAEMAKELDPPSALRAAKRAIESPDLHEAKRARLEAAIDEFVAAGVEVSPDVSQVEAEIEERANVREIEVPESWEEPQPTAVSVPPPPSAVEGPPPIPAVMPPPIPVAARPLESAPESTLDPAPGPALDPAPDPAQTPPPIPPQEPEELFALDSIEELGLDPMAAIGETSRFSGTKIVDAVPTALDDDVVRLLVSGNRKAKLEYEKIEAVGIAVVSGLGPQPILLMDLLLNWTSMDGSALRTIRLRNTQFDPTTLVPDAVDGMQALKEFLRRLIQRSQCVVLPNGDSAVAGPFAVFDDLSSYEREVLMVEG
jgi:membrane associated rhomboid family serine protease